MRTEIVETKSSKENKFPLIAKYVGSGSQNGSFIVLFSEESKGVVIHVDLSYKDRIVGERGDCFHNPFDTDVWKILDEVTVTFKS